MLCSRFHALEAKINWSAPQSHQSCHRAVTERVIEHRDDLVVVEGVYGPGPCIGKESRGVLDNNHCHVRSTRGKGFVTSLGSRNPQDSGNYGGI